MLYYKGLAHPQLIENSKKALHHYGIDYINPAVQNDSTGDMNDKENL